VTTPVFLVDPAAATGPEVVLAGAEGHHAADVRRLRVGEPVDVADGCGTRLACHVRQVDRGRVVLGVDRREVEPEPQPRVVAVQALVKHDAEQAVTTMTEVGVDRVVPWVAARSVVVWQGDRVARGVRRWRSAAAEAAKQSRRSWVPTVTEPCTTDQVAEQVADADLAVLLDGAAQAALTDLTVPDSGTVLVVVGPEGGVTEAERATLVAAGAVPARMGPTVLRAATAGTVAAALLLAATARWHAPARTAG
jgi:16S rRNA (uracil1498-N3)-methyltransferase